MLKILKMTTLSALSAVAVMVALTGPSSDAVGQARAKEQAVTETRGMAVCRADAQSFCKGIEAGRGARLQCLSANKDKLQPACAAAVETRQANRDAKQAARGAGTGAPSSSAAPAGAGGQPLTAARPAGPAKGRPMAACRGDMQTLCASVQPGGGARMRCLTENKAKLTPACADVLASRADAKVEKRAAMKGACKDDARAFCAGSKGPERRQCLTQNVDKISPTCADALKGARG